MKAKNPIKISDKGLEFLKKFKRNRVKVGVDLEFSSYWELIEILGKYFKDHKDLYLELIKIDKVKNGIH